MTATALARADSAISILKESEPLLFADQMNHIGIAPSNARVSDTICRTESLGPNRDEAVTLCMINDDYIVVGHAMFFGMQGGHVREREANRITLHLDFRTLQLLTKESRTCLH
jgi:hypothetical protein